LNDQPAPIERLNTIYSKFILCVSDALVRPRTLEDLIFVFGRGYIHFGDLLPRACAPGIPFLRVRGGAAGLRLRLLLAYFWTFTMTVHIGLWRTAPLIANVCRGDTGVYNRCVFRSRFDTLPFWANCTIVSVLRSVFSARRYVLPVWTGPHVPGLHGSCCADAQMPVPAPLGLHSALLRHQGALGSRGLDSRGGSGSSDGSGWSLLVAGTSGSSEAPAMAPAPRSMELSDGERRLLYFGIPRSLYLCQARRRDSARWRAGACGNGATASVLCS